jgi:hypothetical protein
MVRQRDIDGLRGGTYPDTNDTIGDHKHGRKDTNLTTFTIQYDVFVVRVDA